MYMYMYCYRSHSLCEVDGVTGTFISASFVSMHGLLVDLFFVATVTVKLKTLT